MLNLRVSLKGLPSDVPASDSVRLLRQTEEGKYGIIYYKIASIKYCQFKDLDGIPVHEWHAQPLPHRLWNNVEKTLRIVQ